MNLVFPDCHISEENVLNTADTIRLTDILAEAMETDIICITPFAWCFGMVDITVHAPGKLLPEEFILTVTEDDWNDAPFTVVAVEIAQAITETKKFELICPIEQLTQRRP